jgi:hypothetical protein
MIDLGGSVVALIVEFLAQAQALVKRALGRGLVTRQSQLAHAAQQVPYPGLITIGRAVLTAARVPATLGAIAS